MFRRTAMAALLFIGFCAAPIAARSADQGSEQESGGCTAAEQMCGSTYFTQSWSSQLWRKLGPVSAPTAWIGGSFSFDANSSKSYLVTWRLGSQDATPKGFQVVHTLGGTFYYRDGKTAPADPSTFGYSERDFTIADQLSTAFPSIEGIFPDGTTARACSRDGFSYYLIMDSKDSAAFLLVTPASMAHMMRMDELKAHVALLPLKSVTGDLLSIGNQLQYYTFGGEYEIIEFSAAFYYLAHVPTGAADMELKAIKNGSPHATCPEFPVMGDNGITYSDGWKDAVKSFKN